MQLLVVWQHDFVKCISNRLKERLYSACVMYIHLIFKTCGIYSPTVLHGGGGGTPPRRLASPRLIYETPHPYPHHIVHDYKLNIHLHQNSTVERR